MTHGSNFFNGSWHGNVDQQKKNKVGREGEDVDGETIKG
jgi:hypothetical protein